MIHSIFILNDAGDVLVEKHWRGLVNRSICEYFWEEVTKAGGDVSEIAPVVPTPRFYLYNVVHEVTKGTRLFFIAAAGLDMNALVPFEFLHRVIEVFEDYFGKGFGETVIAEEFTKVYQLLDEMMDNGCPFITEPNILRGMVLPPNIIDKIAGAVAGSSNLGSDLPGCTLTNAPWRRTGVKYANNEIFFDIVEELDAIMDCAGGVVAAEVSGAIMVNSRLSGTPDLSLTFQNPSLLDDVSMHPCVRYQRWEQNRVLSFVPPDGQFKLLTYRVKGGVQLPIGVRPAISFTETGGRVDVGVVVKSVSGGGAKTLVENLIENLVVLVPFPKAVASVNLSCTVGTFAFDQKTKVVTWTLGKVGRLSKMPSLTGTVMLQANSTRPECSGVVSCQFRIPMYTSSGVRVDSLTCNEKYKPYKGVRSVTRAGKYQIRC
eukprot:m51a1_g11857 Adaptor protein complex 3 (AP-3), mu subunit (430) ;mRNA; f:500233-502394